MTRRKRFLAILGAVLFLAALGWAGESDYQEAKRQQAHYCYMVTSGAWPDYRHAYDTLCKEDQTL